MKRPLAIAAALLLLGVNGWVLLGAARNRLGQPDATLTLSERELVVRATGNENSAVAVEFQVNEWQPGRPYERRYNPSGWLRSPRLEEFGFALELPTDLAEARRLVYRQPERRGWAVIALDGERWQAWEGAVQAAAAELDRKIAADPNVSWLEEARRSLDRELQAGTRLFMIDAGADASALRAAYPDGASVLILPARVQLELAVDEGATVCVPQHCRPSGRVSLLTPDLQVPRRLQVLLLPEPQRSRVDGDDDARRPRFSAVVKSGGRREAWLESVSRRE